MSTTDAGHYPRKRPTTGALHPEIPVWGLLGRMLLFAICEALILPFPWAAAYFYRFFCDHVALPDGRRFKFTGRGGDAWYLFMAVPLVIWIGQIIIRGSSADPTHPDPVVSNTVGLAMNIIIWILAVLIIRWVVAHVTSEDDQVSLTFEGGILPFIGWNILLILSVITIIGWAWVAKFFVRWLCRNITGSLGFDFAGTGLDILWRTLAFLIVCLVIIPIPWAMRWYASWYVSQVTVVPAGTPHA